MDVYVSLLSLYTVLCSNLPALTNGVISYSTTAISGSRPWPVDTVATHTCDSGFALSGNEQRTCQSSGEWNGSAPTCVGKVYPIYLIFIKTLWNQNSFRLVKFQTTALLNVELSNYNWCLDLSMHVQTSEGQLYWGCFVPSYSELLRPPSTAHGNHLLQWWN